jgi:hypothetical protein
MAGLDVPKGFSSGGQRGIEEVNPPAPVNAPIAKRPTPQATSLAELLAIDGLYKTADAIEANLRGRPIQAWLDGHTMRVVALD